MDLYSDDMTFNTFLEKKRKDMKMLSVLNDFIKPNPYFVYYMYKDTIHVDDYGSIKETLFKFPSLAKVSKSIIFKYHNFYRMYKTNHTFIYMVMMSTPRFLLAMMSMKMSGP